MITKEEFQQAIDQTQQKIVNSEPESRIFTLSVKKRFDSSTLLDLYSISFPHVKREFWETKIKLGNLTLDGAKVSPNQEVRAGQITQHSEPPKNEPDVSFDINLIEATQDYWIINKPSPLPVHAGGRYQYHTLTHILKKAFPNQSIHLINRLDANTTGALIIALNKKTAQAIGKQFENRSVNKTYLALVENAPSSTYFNSTASIGKSKTPAGGRKLEEGQESTTNFQVLRKFDNTTLLKVTPHSGRTNQIRLHLAGLGFPIIGDLGYKNPEYLKTNPLTYPTDSLFLHSWKISFSYKNEIKSYTASPNQKWFNFL